MSKPPVITIDGPSGSGKGTISQMLAKKFGWHLLNSGALYRALAIAAKNQGVSLKDEAQLAQLAKKLDVAFVASSVFLSGKDITKALTLETTGEMASQIAVFPAVRKALIETQKSFKRSPGLIAEGRDMGTVIFPDATIKIFLEASIEERAQRRYEQLLKLGFNVKLADLLSEVAERDLRDRTRIEAPLKAADDAIIIDTTHLSIKQVFDKVLKIIRNTNR
ncbi:MAG: (d)CMP kinase [Gammaproteobacteria bacterium]|nr:(d)CMP kinase [Gammaproteobacteria bacterium]